MLMFRIFIYFSIYFSYKNCGKTYIGTAILGQIISKLFRYKNKIVAFELSPILILLHVYFKLKCYSISEQSLSCRYIELISC